MYKWIVAAVIGLSVIASFSIIKFGLGPKPIPIIKASNFEDPALLGTYIHRQLFQKLKTSSPLVFGFNKDNPYELKAINTLIELVAKDLGKSPEVVLLTAGESFSGSSFSRLSEIQKRYGEKLLSFSVINLKDAAEAESLENCEKDHTYSVWLECKKKQKVRQINRARKVDLKKPIAVVETQSQKDILIYIKE